MVIEIVERERYDLSADAFGLWISQSEWELLKQLIDHAHDSNCIPPEAADLGTLIFRMIETK